MKIIEFISEEPKTPFAPYWQYVIGEFENALDLKLVQELENIILSKEKEILVKVPAGNDGNTGLGNNSLTSRHSNFNLLSLNEMEIILLKDIILSNYKNFIDVLQVQNQKVWIKCWANVMNYGEEIKEHIHASHSLSWIGGNIIISCENTSTFYVNPITRDFYESKNSEGKLTLFESSMPHYTNKYLGNKKRISIAFDIILDERYQQYSDEDRKIFIELE